MKNFFKNLFSKSEQENNVVATVESVSPPNPPLTTASETPEPKKPRKQKNKVEKKPLSEKDLATLNGEPYINVISMEVNPDDPYSGAFVFDYNEKFIANLIRAGFKLKPSDTDQMLVDRWFQNVARNIALEMYEQEVADPDKRALENLRIIRSRNIGEGRSEVS